MYQLKTEADFDSAHFLSGYTGKCSNIHGHRWHVEIEIESRKLEKDGQERGMLVDFGDLKKDLKQLADSMDHTLIYEENTLRPKTLEALDEEGFHLVKVPFRPTAENFSEHFFSCSDITSFSASPPASSRPFSNSSPLLNVRERTAVKRLFAMAWAILLRFFIWRITFWIKFT